MLLICQFLPCLLACDVLLCAVNVYLMPFHAESTSLRVDATALERFWLAP